MLFGILKSNRKGPYIIQCGVCSFVANTLQITLALKFFGNLMNDLQVYQVVFSITYGVRPLPLPKTSVTKDLPTRLVNADLETVVQSQ